jgi:rhodanese-related sulfurtransferase
VSTARRRSVDDLLADARARIAPRLEPNEALAAQGRGAILVDLRSHDERDRFGIVPDSLHVPLSVLLWRVDPDSGYSNPELGGLEGELVLMCAHGFSSSLAAARLREIGCRRATDVVGGFAAWKAAGLPVVVRVSARERPDELPGMGTRFEPGA